MSFDWNPENTETLKAMRGDGKSYGLIAAHLGTSRNSVISKGNRIGLERTGPQPQVKRKPEDKPRAPRTNHSGFMTKVKAGAAPRPRSAFVPWLNMPKCEAVEAASASEPSPATRCSLLELTDRRCRWPCGDPGEPAFAFCGAPGADLSDRRPYCAFHLARAFVGHRGHTNPLSRKPFDERAA